jgi:rRNA maturation RNase YbeY
MQSNSIEIYNETKWQINTLPFLAIKNKILTKKFSLSVSILNPENAQKVNRKIRNKTYTPNTLSFKYSKTSGEIVLCPEVFTKEDYGVGPKFENKIIYLLIHSCLHLTDLDHGPKMDKLEAKFVKAFVV